MDDDVEVIRWYTRARKFPKFVGKVGFSDRPLPGGPFPVAGVVGFVLAFLVGAQTMGMWGMGSLVVNGFVVFGVSAASGFVAGKLAVGGRNPLMVIQGAWRALAASRFGEFAGRSARVPRSQRVGSRFNTHTPHHPQTPAPDEEPEPTSPEEDNEPASPEQYPKPALSGVQSILAATHLER